MRTLQAFISEEQCECDESWSKESRLLLGILDERFFLWTPRLIHFAARDFFGGRIHEAELAHGQMVVLVTDRGAEGSALHGTEGV